MRWVRRIAIGLGVLVGVALIVIYGGSELVLRRTQAAELPRIAADRTQAGVAEGGRLARVIGCRGCHGDAGQGNLIGDFPGVVHIAPPPLARSIAGYSDPALARLIRHGIKRDGTRVFIMPIEGHARIADDDLAKILGWMRTLRPSAADRTDRLSFGPLGRVGLLRGVIEPQVNMASIAPAKRPANIGRYFSGTVCETCHALHEGRLAPDDERPVPPLAEVGPAYDVPAFKKLLRTGVGMGGRDLGLMTRVAKHDLAYLTDREIEAIHAFLVQESARTVAR